jgi:HEAT repeat protein
MAKARSLKDKLAALHKLRSAPASPLLIGELRAALADPSNFVAAEAADIAGKAQLKDLAPDLVTAFDRFLKNPLKRDQLCKAKTAIAEALNQLDYAEEDFFWLGARYVQLEPVWGGSQDTAGPLRVMCAFSLVRIRARGVLPYLTDLLCDSEKPARIGAAQALAYSETDAAYLLLRFKARVGDEEPEVIAECFNGVLKLKPEEGVPFVAEFLDSHDSGIQEGAILALGDSRRREALEFLKAYWARCLDTRLKEIVLMALALLRLGPATDFLLGLVETENDSVASAALSALALHRYDERIRERTAAAVTQNGRPVVRQLFVERFRGKE